MLRQRAMAEADAGSGARGSGEESRPSCRLAWLAERDGAPRYDPPAAPDGASSGQPDGGAASSSPGSDMDKSAAAVCSHVSKTSSDAAATRAKRQEASLAQLAAHAPLTDRCSSAAARLNGHEQVQLLLPPPPPLPHGSGGTKESPLCSDSELSFVLSSAGSSAAETPRTMRSRDTIRNKDALIAELRERCVALENEGFVLRERMVKMEEDRPGNAALRTELLEMTECVAALHKRQDAEVQRLRTELAAAQAMLTGLRSRRCSEVRQPADAGGERSVWTPSSQGCTGSASERAGEDATELPRCGDQLQATLAVEEQSSDWDALQWSRKPGLPRSEDFHWHSGDDDGAPQSLTATGLQPRSAQQSDCASLSDGSGSAPPSPSSLRRLDTGALVDVPQPASHHIAEHQGSCGISRLAGITCPKSHILHQQPSGGRSWICDGCEATYEANATGLRYRCGPCDYDLCGQCCTGGVSPAVQDSARCTRGHELHAQSAAVEGSLFFWVCDGCQRPCQELVGTARHRCALCDYDLCDACYARRKGSCSLREASDESQSTAAGISAGESELSWAESGSSHGSGHESSRASDMTATASTVTTVESASLERGRQLWQEPTGLRKGRSLDKVSGKGGSHVVATRAFPALGVRRCCSVDSERPTRDGSAPQTPSFGSPCPALPVVASPVVPSGTDTYPGAAVSMRHSSHQGSPRSKLQAQQSPASSAVDPQSAASTATCVAPMVSAQPRLQMLGMPPIAGTQSPGVATGLSASVPSMVVPSAGGHIRLHQAGHGSGLPATREAFVFLHNAVAMPLMKRAADLGQAYRLLAEANSLHVRLHGIVSGEALYNMACCLSLGAAAVLTADATQGVVADVAPGLPPRGPGRPKEIVDARLDESIRMLEAAAEAGYGNAAHMASDADLAAARERRPTQFAAAVERVRAGAAALGGTAAGGRQGLVAGGSATISCSRKVPQVSPPMQWAKA